MRTLAVALSALLLVGCQSEEDKARAAAEMREIKLNRVAADAVRGTLKDPSSAEFRNQHGLCGEVNARNSFGGYGGFRRFVVISESLVMTESDMPPDAFAQLWASGCKH
jgi:hypothetical protein